MPRYSYDAVDDRGEPSGGEVEADDPGSAIDRLERRGLARISIASAAPLSAAEGAEFARQVADLVSGGLPLAPALRALREEMPSARLRGAFDRLAARLERGESLDEAVEAADVRLPDPIRGLVVAGTRSGRLGEVLGQFSDQQVAAGDRDRTLWLDLAYPLILLAIGVAIFVGIAQVAAGFRPIYQDFGIELPGFTKLLLTLVSGLEKLSAWSLIGPILVVAALKLAERTFLGAAERRRLAGGIPLFGALWRWSSLADFSSLLAILLEAEIPLTEAIPLAAGGVGDAGLVEVGRRVADRVRGGASFADAVVVDPAFPGGYARLMRWAEPHRGLPDTLRMIAEMYASRAQVQARIIARTIGVVALAMTLVFAAIMYLGMLLPLLRLISLLSG